MTVQAGTFEALAKHGFAVEPCWLELATVSALASCARERLGGAEAAPAAVGRGAGRRRDAAVRGDSIAWFGPPYSPIETDLVARLESLRLGFNESLQLGLFEFEGHYACYPAGAGYVRHLDRHTGSVARTVSFVLYLNEDWGAGDGGELCLYDGAAADPLLRVIPRGGTAVCFLAERFEHEVRPARRDRLSFTGWFRRRDIAGLPFAP